MARKLTLAPDGSGYVLDGVRVDGFPDDRDLPGRLRHRIARWARARAPDTLDSEQRELLESFDRAAPSEQRRRADERGEQLSWPTIRPLWRTLEQGERDAVLHVDRTLGEGARFPLTVGQLSELVAVDKQNLRRWPLPHTRDGRGHREYGAAAAVMAFSMRDSKQNDREVYSDLRRSAQPIADLRRKLALLTYQAFSSDVPAPAEQAQRELDALVDEVESLARALNLVADLARGSSSTKVFVGEREVSHPFADQVEFDLHHLGALANLVEPVGELEAEPSGA